MEDPDWLHAMHLNFRKGKYCYRLQILEAKSRGRVERSIYKECGIPEENSDHFPESTDMIGHYGAGRLSAGRQENAGKIAAAVQPRWRPKNT
jgi:hypothetical protein